MAIRRRKAIRYSNPRVACGSVSKKRNKYVGATFVKVRGPAKGSRRVIGCARVGDDSGYYATRVVGAKGTRYTPIKKRSLRDLKHSHKSAVKMVRHSGVKLTDASLIEAFAKRYAKPVKAKKAKTVVANPTKRTTAPANRDEAYELLLHIYNTEGFYRQMLVIDSAMRRKGMKGKYDGSLAPKAFLYVVDAAARDYRKENSMVGGFNPATRLMVAKQLTQRFENDFEQLSHHAGNKRSVRSNPAAKTFHKGQMVSDRSSNFEGIVVAVPRIGHGNIYTMRDAKGRVFKLPANRMDAISRTEHSQNLVLAMSRR